VGRTLPQKYSSRPCSARKSVSCQGICGGHRRDANVRFRQSRQHHARHIHPKRATDMTRSTPVWLSQWFTWQQALTVVSPQTFMRWRRQGWGAFSCWKARWGRPRISDAVGEPSQTGYEGFHGVTPRAVPRCAPPRRDWLCGRQSSWRRSARTSGVHPIAGCHASMPLVSPPKP
jgi:hypothetical protein